MRPQALMVVLAGIVAGTGAARASDGLLRHTLQAARCSLSTVRQIERHSHVTVYEARCGGREPRTLQISCTRQACRVDDDTGTEP